MTVLKDLQGALEQQRVSLEALHRRPAAAVLSLAYSLLRMLQAV